MEKNFILRSNFSSFPQRFQYISNFNGQITYLFVKSGCSFFLNLQICYVEVRISRNITESPMDFDITRVNVLVDLFSDIGQ